MNAKMKPKGSTPQLQQGSCPSRAFERSSPRRAGIAADDQRFLGERIVVTVFVIEHPRTRCAPTPRPGRRRTHRELPFPRGPCRWQSPLSRGAHIRPEARARARARDRRLHAPSACRGLCRRPDTHPGIAHWSWRQSKAGSGLRPCRAPAATMRSFGRWTGGAHKPTYRFPGIGAPVRDQLFR